MGLLNPKLPDGMDWNQYLEQRMSDPLRPNLSSRLTQQDLVNKGLLAIGMAPLGMTGKAKQAVEAYQGLHKPPMKGSGAPLHDVTGGGTVYPDDIYGPMGTRYYGPSGGYDPMDFEGMNVLQYAHNKPDRLVTMYRSVPYEKSPAEQAKAIEKQLQKFMARRIVPKEWGGSRTEIGDEEGFYKWATSELDRLKAMPVEKAPKLTINHGDWVTTSKRYAKEHGESNLQGKYKILSKQVPARKLFTSGDSYLEFGYDETGKILPGLLPYVGGAGLLGAYGVGKLKKDE